MAFIEPDEFVLLFDYPDHATFVSSPGSYQIPVDDMRRLREVGVKTVLQLLFWSEVEKSPGIYDWSISDAYIAKSRAAGMKTLLLTYDMAVTWAPPEWYLRGADGTIHNGAGKICIF